ncbi:MAG: phosphohydrolase [Desulfocapsa sp.]|nr:MAG: phosphohydrolase [Desulfocapsa sp.]
MSTRTQTYSGKIFNLLVPTAAQIDIRDIAKHLSRINRFSGATTHPYSVAQHSVLVCAIATEISNSPLTGLYGLIHDAHEAYVGDIPSPVKRALESHLTEFNRFWDSLTDNIDKAVRKKINLPVFISDKERELVQRADLIALATERQLIMAPGDDWGLSEKPWSAIGDLPPLTPEEAEALFLSTFKKTLSVVSFWANNAVVAL